MPERRLKRTSKSTHFGAKKKQKLVRFGKHFGSLKLGILGNHFNTRLEGVPNDTPGVLVQNPYPALFTASEPTVYCRKTTEHTIKNVENRNNVSGMHIWTVNGTFVSQTST